MDRRRAVPPRPLRVHQAAPVRSKGQGRESGTGRAGKDGLGSRERRACFSRKSLHSEKALVRRQHQSSPGNWMALYRFSIVLWLIEHVIAAVARLPPSLRLVLFRVRQSRRQFRLREVRVSGDRPADSEHGQHLSQQLAGARCAPVDHVWPFDGPSSRRVSVKDDSVAYLLHDGGGGVLSVVLDERSIGCSFPSRPRSDRMESHEI